MKITVIYDSKDKGTLYQSVQFVLEKIRSNNINTVVSEFIIGQDFDSYFLDCYSNCRYYCTHEGEMKNCLYLKIIQKLSSNINNSDLIILASSSSKHNIGSNMYKVLENLSYIWMPHKHNNVMINKIALAISNTSSFSVFSYANMTLSRILRFWGINKHSILSKSLNKYSRDNISEEKYTKLISELTEISSKIVNKYRQTSAIIFPNFNTEKSSCVYKKNKASIIKLPNNNNFQKKYVIRKFTHRKIL